MSTKSLWVVCIRGEPSMGEFELSVVRNGNTHGRRSYGWAGPDKILVATSDRADGSPDSEMVWGYLLAAAIAIAGKLNAERGVSEGE